MCVCVCVSQDRLAYLTNKCFGDADLEYYIAEAGHILGVRAGENTGAKHVLAEVSTCSLESCLHAGGRAHAGTS